MKNQRPIAPGYVQSRITIDVPSELAKPMLDALYPLIRNLEVKAALHEERVERRRRMARRNAELGQIGEEYDRLRLYARHHEAITEIMRNTGEAEETVVHYVRTHQKLKTRESRSKRHRLILSMYAAGFSNADIQSNTGYSLSTVNRVVSKAKHLMPRHEVWPTIHKKLGIED